MAKKKKPIMSLADYLSEEGNLEKELEAARSLEEDEDFDPSMFAGVVSLEDLLEGDSEVRYLTLDNLGSLFVELNVKSRDGRTSVRRPKVYFTAHKDDFDKYFDEITDKIASVLNCDIYYLSADDDADDEIGLAQRISEMSLFVFPVTKTLLSKGGRALDVELSAAIDYGVPIVPVFIDGDIDDFNNKVGTYEVIEYGAGFDKKLEKFLNNTLFGGESAKRIESEFTSSIFLSYRKKDVDSARKLIDVLRKDKALNDVIVWYDNYLTVGEDYNEEIASALSSCDLFALLVTPNLVGEENYVSKIEYPSAVRAGKSVFAVEAVPCDRKLLEKKYSGEYPLFSIDDDKAIIDHIKTHLSEKLASVKNTPEHKYYVGLAYYAGVKAEVDRDLGVRLLLESAESGFIPALIRLLSIRRYNSDIIESKKLVGLCESALKALSDGDNEFDIDSYETVADELVSEYITSYQTKKAEALIIKLLDLVCKTTARRVTYYEKYARLYFRLASALEMRGEYKDAELYADFALEYMEKILSSDVADTPDALYYRVLGTLASVAFKCGKADKAAAAADKAKNRFNRDGVKLDDDEKLAYAQFALAYSTVLYQNGDPNGALELAFSTEKMLAELKENNLTIDTLSSLYETIGMVYYSYANGEARHLNAALHYLEKAIETVKNMDESNPNGKMLRIAKFSLNYGAALSQCNIGDEALNVLREVIDICKTAEFDDGQRYLFIKESVGAIAIELVSQKKYDEAIRFYDDFFALVREETISSHSQYYDCANFAYRAAYISVKFLNDAKSAEKYKDKAIEFIGLCDITDDDVIKLYHEVNEL